MSLALGVRLGRYEVVSLLGAGGMGEVYRGRDPRLGREIALKVLPSSFIVDPNRVRLFEQEARAAGSLAHPNILTVFDVGVSDQTPYIVSELLQGSTLRDRLQAGRPGLDRALEWAIQIARGLAAAHQAGIVHRDLKPANVFIQRDGLVKILDFGLAKLVARPRPSDDETSSDQTSETQSWRVVGTAGYMAPEQIRGRAVDARSDIFSFGAIFYEMLAGRRAFRGASNVETMNAILAQDPPDLAGSAEALPPALPDIVKRCLAKDPEERFGCAADLAFALENVTRFPGPGLPASRWPRRRILLGGLGTVLVAAAALFTGAALAPRVAAPPEFRRITFQRGTVDSARFTPDGQSIVYAASWAGAPLEVFSTRIDAREPLSLGYGQGVGVLAVSTAGDLALSMGRPDSRTTSFSAGLAVVPMGGHSLRDVADNVTGADWSPDSKELAVLRFNEVQFPPGRVLYSTERTWLSHVRVSPDGQRVAFIEHGRLGDASIVVVDRAGNKRPLSAGWAEAGGLAWSPQGRELWFTAARGTAAKTLNAVSLAGRERLVTRLAGSVDLLDVSRDGRVLVDHASVRGSVVALLPGEAKERDLSWLDTSAAVALAVDGSQVVLQEWGEGGGPESSVYLRRTDGSPAVRLGEGAPLALSPDGLYVLASLSSPARLVLLPTGRGETRSLDHPGFTLMGQGAFIGPRRIVFSATRGDERERSYVVELSGGEPRKAAVDWAFAASADGRLLVGGTRDGQVLAVNMETGTSRPVPGLTLTEPRCHPVQVAADARSLYCVEAGPPALVFRVDLATGRREKVREINPGDRAGLLRMLPLQMTPDAKTIVYTNSRKLSELYVIDGLK